MSKMMRMAGVRQAVDVRRFEFVGGLFMAMGGLVAILAGGLYLMHTFVGRLS